MPHGVLFRGGKEKEARKKMLQAGHLEAVIGLPPGLFYGTGIPACVLVLNKKDANRRKRANVLDASSINSCAKSSSVPEGLTVAAD